MRFLWYWPFARSEEMALAHACARGDDRLVVQTIDRPVAPAAGRTGEVEVINDLPDVDRSVTGRISWARSRAGTYVTRSRRRRRLVKSENFDLTHLHYVNRFTDVVDSVARPLVMSVHDVVPHQPRVGELGERMLLRRLYRRADALVVHHSVLAQKLADDFDLDRSRIHVVPHQVFAVDHFEMSRPEGRPSLLVFGALRPNKGLEVLDLALQQLKGVDVDVVIAGRGAPEVEALAVAMSERDARVTLELGHVDDRRKGELFRASSLVLLPYTRFASQSGVLHDAYGHRRPVIVSDVGALGESVREDGTGLVVSPGDPAGLAQAIMDAVVGEHWVHWQQRCDAIAVERAPRVVGRQLRSVYDVVLADVGRRRG